MSGPPGFVNQGKQHLDEEEDDAALIDSFFLPGGILDPNEDETGDVLANVPPFDKSDVSRVPSNPWSSDNFLRGISPKTSGVPLPRAAVRPPPGYAQRVGYSEQDQTGPTSQSFFASEGALFTSQQTEQRKSFGGDDILPGLGSLHQVSLGAGNAKAFHDHAHHRSHKSVESAKPAVLKEADNPTTDETEMQIVPSLPVSTSEVEVPPRDQSSKNQTPAIADASPVRYQQPYEALQDTINGIKKDSSEEGRNAEGDEDDEIGQQESDDSEISFPIKLLTFESQSTRESTTSLLSTSTSSTLEQNNSQHNSNDESGESEKNNEDQTEALDSGAAVVRLADSNADDPENDIHTSDLSTPPEAPNVLEIEGKPSGLRSEPVLKSGSAAESIKVQDRILQFVSSVALLLYNAIANMIKILPNSTIYQSIYILQRSLARQVKSWQKNFHEYTSWLADFKEVVAALLSKLIVTLRWLLSVASKVLAVSALLLFQVWKFSMVEIVEEPKVAICYFVFYFMPNFCSLLFKIFIIPHWTPHFATALAVWSLCNQIMPGSLQMDRISIPRLLDRSGKQDEHLFCDAESRPRDERACKTILRILRLVLPIFFFADGFSNEFATIMGVSGASRLTTAYMMSLVRKNRVSSPVGWASWAIQVLVTTYYPSWLLLDLVVLLAGLSSIRLIRYLEGLRVKAKRRNGKYN